MRFFTVSTAGHVDHGKTSLLRVLTGIDPDRLKEEKERQMTTDLGFAFLQLDDAMIVGFVDVPGHGKFLKNMLAGVGGIDMALLVVAADEGPMPQTVQHVRILSLLGVNKAVVAMTKIDMVDDAEKLQVVKEEIAELLKRHDVSMLALVPVSSATGEGMDLLKKAIGENLRKLPQRDTGGGAFLPVDRVFSKSGFGTVVTGTLVRGKLSVGDQVVIGPDVSSARVRRLETHGHEVTVARAGQRLACNLVLKDNKTLTRGHLVLSEPVPASKMLIASLRDRPAIAGEKFAQALREQPVRVYHGTAEHHGRIRWADTLDSGSGQRQVIGLITLEQPMPAQPFDHFLVRMSDDKIFGGQVVLREKPRWINRSTIAKLALQISESNLDDAAVALVEGAPHSMLKLAQLSILIPQPQDGEVADHLVQRKKLVRVADTLMLPQVRAALQDQLISLIKQNAEKESAGLTSGIALETVRGLLKPRLDRVLFQALVDEELQAGTLLRSGDKLTLPGAAPKRAPDSGLESKIVQALTDNFCLDLKELAAACGSDANKVKAAVQILEKNGGVRLVNYEFAISDEHLRKAHAALATVWHKARNISPSEFRETLGTTRKYAMALLQYFDDHKITRRLGAGRVLLKAPES